MNTEELLFGLQDVKYRDFQAKLMPTVDPETMIGVRTPELRKLAKALAKDPEADVFLSALPHRDFARCISMVENFLPYVDNWATCDQMSPKVFKKHRPELLEHIKNWIVSDKTYTVRFAIGMLMEHYLSEDFDPVYPEMVSQVRSGEYYINMMIAWYFATALAKQYDAVIPYIENKKLDVWTHNKTIQQKDYLRTLKIRK